MHAKSLLRGLAKFPVEFIASLSGKEGRGLPSKINYEEHKSKRNRQKPYTAMREK